MPSPKYPKNQKARKAITKLKEFHISLIAKRKGTARLERALYLLRQTKGANFEKKNFKSLCDIVKEKKKKNVSVKSTVC